MKISNKIALSYTSVILGIIVVIAIVFYIVATLWLNNLTQSYLPEGRIGEIGKDNHWDKIILYGNQIKQGIGWMLCGLVVISSVLIYWVGKHSQVR